MVLSLSYIFAVHFKLYEMLVDADLYSHEASLLSSTRNEKVKRQTIFTLKGYCEKEKKRVSRLTLFMAFLFGKYCECSEHKALFDVLKFLIHRIHFSCEIKQ